MANVKVSAQAGPAPESSLNETKATRLSFKPSFSKRPSTKPFDEALRRSLAESKSTVAETFSEVRPLFLMDRAVQGLFYIQAKPSLTNRNSMVSKS